MNERMNIRTTVRSVLSLPSILFLRRLVSDKTLGLSPIADDVLRAMRVSNRSIYGDRFYEMCMFWRMSPVRAFLFFMRHGWPFSKRLYASLYSRFESKTAPGKLRKAYKVAAFHYSLVLMLSMHRGEWLLPFLGEIQDHLRGRSKARILEYGCGVSDMGLLLAKEGYDVTIVDLADRKLEFAEWRYRIRRLACSAVSVADTEEYAELPQSAFDVVVASEVLEHVRDPLGLLIVLTESLAEGGLLFCTTGNSLDRKVEGDHLPEAVRIGNSPEYREYFNAHYSVFAEKPGMPFLFRKVEPRERAAQ